MKAANRAALFVSYVRELAKQLPAAEARKRAMRELGITQRTAERYMRGVKIG
jgi:hypothetical protein